MQPKILLFDIETSPSTVFVWDLWETNALKVIKPWQILCISWKYLGKKSTNYASQRIFTEKELVKKLWDLFNEADIISGHNCVEEHTKVLKTDLTWIEAGKLKIGDKLVAFEEDKKPNCSRKIIESTVEYNVIEEKECYKITLSSGEEIITTPDHKWLKMDKRGRDYRWCETKNLIIGQRVEKFMTPWEKDNSYESGWLSGFISGEGTLKQSGLGFSIDFCQRPGVTMNQAINYCKKLDIDISDGKIKRGGLGKGDTLYSYTRGGKFEAIKTLGRLQIKRMIDKIKWNNFGTLKSRFSKTLDIIGIEYVGKKNVAILQTSSKTFFAEGFAMHNCDKFDIRKSNAKFIEYGFKPPATYKTVDTLKIARRYFRFDSNKLDSLGEYLGLGRKVKTGGFDLWDRCIQGEEKALRLMEKYNKKDVELLENVYLKLRPWMTNHPNLNLISETRHNCPICESSKVQRRGFSYSRVNKYQRWQCLECGGWSQSPINKILR